MTVDPEPMNGVEDNIAPFGHVEQRIFQHANRLDGGVILKTLSSFGARAGGIASQNGLVIIPKRRRGFVL